VPAETLGATKKAAGASKNAKTDEGKVDEKKKSILASMLDAGAGFSTRGSDELHDPDAARSLLHVARAAGRARTTRSSSTTDASRALLRQPVRRRTKLLVAGLKLVCNVPLLRFYHYRDGMPPLASSW
jgi:hypothetical protein